MGIHWPNTVPVHKVAPVGSFGDLDRTHGTAPNDKKSSEIER